MYFHYHVLLHAHTTLSDPVPQSSTASPTPSQSIPKPTVPSVAVEEPLWFTFDQLPGTKTNHPSIQKHSPSESIGEPNSTLWTGSLYIYICPKMQVPPNSLGLAICLALL